MAHEPITSYPKNTPGDFSVEDGCRLCCEAPYHEAPVGPIIRTTRFGFQYT